MSKMSKTSITELQATFFFIFNKYFYMVEVSSFYCFGSPRVKIAALGSLKCLNCPVINLKLHFVFKTWQMALYDWDPIIL